MRYQNVLTVAIVLVLSVLTFSSVAYSDQSQRAVRAESVGFDALAHTLFGSKGAR